MVGYDERQRQLTTYQYALAGATSGVVTRLLLQPLDVVKIRLQIQVEPTEKVFFSMPLTKPRF
jgi:solute carrier family 25 thiamine pyrophosphate transporter 19